MLNEIDKDFYCSAGCKLKDKRCRIFSQLDCEKDHCSQRHRKYPTPEQFKEEYGFEVPDDFPIFYFNPNKKEWELGGYWIVKQIKNDLDGLDKDFGVEIDNTPLSVVCCTPFGKPDKDWRPT